MLAPFAFHHCSAHTQHRTAEIKRGGKSLPPAAGGAAEQPTSGVGDLGEGLEGGIERL